VFDLFDPKLNYQLFLQTINTIRIYCLPIPLCNPNPHQIHKPLSFPSFRPFFLFSLAVIKFLRLITTLSSKHTLSHQQPSPILTNTKHQQPPPPCPQPVPTSPLLSDLPSHHQPASVPAQRPDRPNTVPGCPPLWSAIWRMTCWILGRRPRRSNVFQVM
jgi:hypothetical protein